MRRFSESSYLNIFDNINILTDMLIEFNDISLKFDIKQTLQKKYLDRIYPIDGNFDSFKDESIIRTYIIDFEISQNVITCDKQRLGNMYYLPDNKLYDFFKISKDIQYKIESLNNTYLLTINENKISIMILEGRHK